MSDQNRILCTHLGSLARPARLLDFISAIDKGVPVQQDAFEGCLKSAVAEVVAQQAKAGVDIVSDGDVRQVPHLVGLCVGAPGGH
jgi:5-methyltetrahydropteroyltriglutamate--homocysteine methyltransferase